MKRNLIAVAVAAALAVPATATLAGDLTVYGQGQVEISNYSFSARSDVEDAAKVADPKAYDSVTEVADNARGRIGFKADEDLGGSLKGVAKMEFKVDTADGVASGTDVSLAKREMMVGLKGGFGQFELGRLKTPYKYTGGVAYDPFVATALEARGTAGMSGQVGKGNGFGHNGFQSDSLGWRSPKWGPVELEAIYGPETDDSSYSVSAKVSMPIFEAFVAANSHGDLGGKTTVNGAEVSVDYSAVKIGGQLRFAGGNHKVSLQYEMITNDNNGNDDPTHLFLGYHGKIGKTELVAQLGLATHDDTDSTTAFDDSYDEVYYALGAIYKFSKQTRVFGGFAAHASDEPDALGSQDFADIVFSVGLRKDFSS